MHDHHQRTATCLGLLLALAPGAAAAEPTPSRNVPPVLTAAAATATPAAAAAPAATPAVAPAKPASKRKPQLRPCPANVPEELNPPADVTLELVLPANGVQSYACTAEKPGAPPEWTGKGPHALLTEGPNVIGIHGGGPSWQGLDGSMVRGTRMAVAPGPNKSALIWMLLSGAATGEGTFSKITHIQRLETVGGKPPEGGCDAAHIDAKVLIPYRSNYYFYRLSDPGETVRQCRSAPGKAAKADKGK